MNLYQTQNKVLRTLETCQTYPQLNAAIRYAGLWIDMLIRADANYECDELIDCAGEVSDRIKQIQKNAMTPPRKSTEVMNDIPVCPRCRSGSDKSCVSQLDKSNGRRLKVSTWKCSCGCRFTANIDLDSEELVSGVNDFVKPIEP